MNQMQISRVTVDFPLPERDTLQLLCDTDLRPAAEQIRWLVLKEAKRRSIQMQNRGALESHPEHTAAAS